MTYFIWREIIEFDLRQTWKNRHSIFVHLCPWIPKTVSFHLLHRMCQMSRTNQASMFGQHEKEKKAGEKWIMIYKVRVWTTNWIAGFGLGKDTRNACIIPVMDEMSPEEYRMELQRAAIERQRDRWCSRRKLVFLLYAMEKLQNVCQLVGIKTNQVHDNMINRIEIDFSLI
jgi:hypothetical protein